VIKTDIFFLIHNFNTVPYDLLEYCKEYVIYDASTDADILHELQKLNCVRVRNTGHNISSYFQYFAEHYDNLPEHVALLKGNMIGRHVSREFFERSYDNHFFTFLYEDRGARSRIRKDVFFLCQENQYVEINNSWYANTQHPKKYFSNYNDLLTFIYQDPVIPEYCCFAPGACYIVSRHQILKNSFHFYRNLHSIISYVDGPNSPCEAHQIERMLPTIFSSSYLANEWMNSEVGFNEAIRDRTALLLSSANAEVRPMRERFFKALKGLGKVAGLRRPAEK
jgi:Protein of unknown function (DUF3431)